MMKFRYTPPRFIQSIFPDFIWKTKNDKLLLTFDDGPNPSTTELILKQLELNKTKALFFCVGNNVRKYPELVSAILSEGHSIGNHTYDHKIISGLSRGDFIREIELFNATLKNISNQRIEYFRPPHGKFDLQTNKFIRQAKLTNIMWTLVTYDYKNNSNIVKFALKNYLRNDSIIVMHDSNKSANVIEDAIQMLFDEANLRGFQIGGPEECLK